MSITAPAASGPIIRPMPFVVVASPETVPRWSAGISLKRRPQASVITAPPATATTKMRPRYHACHSVPRPPARRPNAVDDRGERDHPRDPDAVADRPGEQRCDDVAAGDRGQDERRGDERLVEADGDVEDDERARTGEGALPGRVRGEEGRDVAVRAQHAPRVRDVRPDALEHASRARRPRSTKRIGTRQAAVVTTAATRNGAGRQRWKRNPPPIRAPPIATPRNTCCTPCARPKTTPGSRSG